mmetsp:Transcript_21600/g.69562  ORF Transcript_21600/g.69562 Transcript_21600/m.69562 type:complete len:272 (-) Transcript_21600:210-1025(-)
MEPRLGLFKRRGARPPQGEAGRRVRDPGAPRRLRRRERPTGSQRRHDHGRGRLPRQRRHEGLPQEPRGERRRLQGRLVPLGRHRRRTPRRIRRSQGPRQGRRHLRRRKHLLPRGRGRHHGTPRRHRVRRGAEARPQVGRTSLLLRRDEASLGPDREGPHRLREDEARRLQDSQERRLRPPPEDGHRENPKVRPQDQSQGPPGLRIIIIIRVTPLQLIIHPPLLRPMPRRNTQFRRDRPTPQVGPGRAASSRQDAQQQWNFPPGRVNFLQKM